MIGIPDGGVIDISADVTYIFFHRWLLSWIDSFAPMGKWQDCAIIQIMVGNCKDLDQKSSRPGKGTQGVLFRRRFGRKLLFGHRGGEKDIAVETIG